MASDQILKKTVLGGFRKEDVINYVEHLQAEILRLKNDIGRKNEELESIEKNNASSEALEGEINALKAEKDKLKAELEQVKAENSKLRSELSNNQIALIETDCLKSENENLRAELEKCKGEYDEKLAVYQQKLSSIEEMVSSIEAACGKLDESETAAAKAEEITEKLNKAVADALAQVSEANDRLKTACVSYDSSTVMLKASVENLMAILNSLAEGNIE